MNEHNLDDLIIGDPAPAGKKSKSFLAMIALVVIILLGGILLSKMILGTSDEEVTVADQNQTEFVSPELIPLDGNRKKRDNDLKPIGKETLPSASKVKKQTAKKQTAKKQAKQQEVTRKVTQKKPVTQTKPQTTAPKKSVPKRETKPTKRVKKQPKASTLFAEGKPVYYIQIGAFNRPPNPKFLNKIESAGLKYVINKNEKTRRVRVGPYGSYAEAKAALSDVNSSIGIMGFVVKQK